jgi:hypothetical protein
MDGAWALYEAWLRLQEGDIDIAVVTGSGRSSTGDPSLIYPMEMDPYYLAPIGADPVTFAALQARAVIAAGIADERSMAEASIRARGKGTVDELLAGEYVRQPLRRHDLPPITDGAAAMVLARGDRARELVERPAYITGFVLVIAWIREQLNGPYRRTVARLVSAGIAIGLALSVLVHYPALMRSAMASAAGPPTELNPAPIRKYDPTARLRGWQTLAKEVDVIRDRVRAETGEEPLVAGTVWNVPGALGAYCKGHPETYSFGLAMGDRHSQYDIWRPNPVADAQAFRGRTFVFVGDGLPADAGVFEQMEPPTVVVHREEGVPVAVWWVWVGHGFRGFPDKPIYGAGTRY